MSQVADRRTAFKNAGKTTDEMRRKRCEVNVELRKAHKDDQLFKRRNIDNVEDSEEDLDTSAEASARGSCMSPIKMSVPEMIEGMKSDNPQIRMIATRSARKMLSKERHPPIDELIQAGVVPICVALLDDEANPNTQFEAAWALTNIASGTSDQTLTVIRADAIPKFMQLLKSPHLNLAEQATWALGTSLRAGNMDTRYVT
uniref:Importin subunit alpha-5 n=1 Tax=Cacopsylla melanoneura TaxID=428564 RepID=A0A8D9E4N4_9HEMI